MLTKCFRPDDAPRLRAYLSGLKETGCLPIPLLFKLDLTERPATEFILLTEDKGQIVGCLDTCAEPDSGRMVFELIMPRERGEAAGPLLEYGAMYSAALSSSLAHVMLPEGDSRLRLAAEGRGFTPVRRLISLTLDSPKPTGGSGNSIRSIAPGEEELINRVQDLAFSDTWGFQPVTADEIRLRLRLPCSTREGVLLARIDEEAVGYCWTRKLLGRGEIWMIGVLPDWRGRGIGKALLSAGINHLLSHGCSRIGLTADEQNLPALRLYRKLGFKQSRAVQCYERRLRGE